MQIKCPYCTQVEATVRSGSVFFPDHATDWHNGEPITACLAAEQTFQIVSEKKELCSECVQEVLILVDGNGNSFPEGHNYSLEDGKKVPPKPDAGFYSKIWCNTGFSKTQALIPIHQESLQEEPVYT